MASPTFHTTLLQLAQAPLLQLASVPPASVHLERLAPFDDADCPAINLLPGETRFEVFGAESADHALLKATANLYVRVHTRGGPHTQTADPAIGEANAALMADPSLGGHCLRLRLLSSRPQQAQADSTAGLYELAYEAVLIVSERTLALQPL